ncbi:hypothetical protein B0H14DRAFT_3162483 [Mycena olivaceomarginata]|nr:hypothetical protein B0H14DRAFT_3162483 [Mycena olivaceomarginata]
MLASTSGYGPGPVDMYKSILYLSLSSAVSPLPIRSHPSSDRGSQLSARWRVDRACFTWAPDDYHVYMQDTRSIRGRAVFLDYKVLVAILRTRLDIFPLQIQIELIASVKARAIPAASDMFGLVLLILSHPNGTQGGSYRLDSGGTASAGRTPVRFGVEPPFLNYSGASGVPPGSVRNRDAASTVFNFCVVLYLVFPECRLYPTQPGIQVDSYRLDSDGTATPVRLGVGPYSVFLCFLFDSLASKAADDRDLFPPPIPWHSLPVPPSSVCSGLPTRPCGCWSTWKAGLRFRLNSNANYSKRQHSYTQRQSLPFYEWPSGYFSGLSLTSTEWAIRHLSTGEDTCSMKDAKQLLQLCTGIIDIMVDYDFTSPKFLPFIAEMRVERLAMDLEELFEFCSINLAHPLFHSVTHLDIFGFAAIAEVLLDVRLLPGLTHLALDRYIPRKNMARTPHVYDVRFVIAVDEDYWGNWLAGTRGLPDFWAQADAFMACKRNGEVEDTRYWLS